MIDEFAKEHLHEHPRSAREALVSSIVLMGDPRVTAIPVSDNRAVLTDALRSAGLVNYPTEWWHWSYGDRYWAMATGAPSAIYGTVDRR